MRKPPPDGYRWAADGVGLVLIDPTDCPAGHRFRFGQRGGLAHCGQHPPHNTWICECGQRIAWHAGQFRGQLDCITLDGAGRRSGLTS
jgi:hypothetical protein